MLIISALIIAISAIPVISVEPERENWQEEVANLLNDDSSIKSAEEVEELLRYADKMNFLLGNKRNHLVEDLLLLQKDDQACYQRSLEKLNTISDRLKDKPALKLYIELRRANRVKNCIATISETFSNLIKTNLSRHDIRKIRKHFIDWITKSPIGLQLVRKLKIPLYLYMTQEKLVDIMSLYFLKDLSINPSDKNNALDHIDRELHRMIGITNRVRSNMWRELESLRVLENLDISKIVEAPIETQVLLIDLRIICLLGNLPNMNEESYNIMRLEAAQTLKKPSYYFGLPVEVLIQEFNNLLKPQSQVEEWESIWLLLRALEFILSFDWPDQIMSELRDISKDVKLLSSLNDEKRQAYSSEGSISFVAQISVYENEPALKSYLDHCKEEYVTMALGVLVQLIKIVQLRMYSPSIQLYEIVDKCLIKLHDILRRNEIHARPLYSLLTQDIMFDAIKSIMAYRGLEGKNYRQHLEELSLTSSNEFESIKDLTQILTRLEELNLKQILSADDEVNYSLVFLKILLLLNDYDSSDILKEQ